MSGFELKPLHSRIPKYRITRNIEVAIPAPREVSQPANEYWKRFYQDKDDLVRAWHEARVEGKIPSDRMFGSMLSRGVLDVDELPEPYLGFPHEKIEAVMLNLNPGGSAGRLDDTKKYNSEKGNNPLFDYFVDHGKSYYEFIRQYSSLYSKLSPLNGTKFEVCGVKDFWQGKDGNGGRVKWLRQIYANPNLSSDRVFALEICPYHSLQTDGFQNEVLNMPQEAMKAVVSPAAVAVIENRLPFATCVGVVYDRLFQGLKRSSCKGKWTKQNRTYTLYEVFGDWDSCKEAAHFLVTWAPGGNNAPAKEYVDIEEEVRKTVGVGNQ